ncbi:hypothetical protein T03_12896, partial [Trichinella britovi]
LERVWFDYCSVHVFTVISHVSTISLSGFLHRHSKNEFLHFVIAMGFPQWIEKMYKNLWLNGVTQYCSRNLCGFAYRNTYIVNIVDLHWFSDTSYKSGSACCHQCVWYFCRIRNHVDKYVITKHYYQLMPLSLATYIRNHVDKYVITKHKKQQLMPLRMDYIINIDQMYVSYSCVKVGLMALLSIGPEICVASLIAGVHHISLVVRVAISAF